MHSNEMTFASDPQAGRQEVAEYSLRHRTCIEGGFSTVSEGQEVIETLLTAMSHRGYSEQDRFAVHLALEEAIVNAIKHGNHYDPAKRVRVDYEITDRRVLAHVADQGAGFDPDRVPDPTLPENLEKDSGRGVMLMREFMTWIGFNERGNRVTLCRHRSARTPRPNGKGNDAVVK